MTPTAGTLYPSLDLKQRRDVKRRMRRLLAIAADERWPSFNLPLTPEELAYLMEAAAAYQPWQEDRARYEARVQLQRAEEAIRMAREFLK